MTLTLRQAGAVMLVLPTACSGIPHVTHEILSGTDSNLALHGQRMAGSFFRMITF